MKFNKELDENAVPEWKQKYLDYKQGKKKLKAVARAIRTVDRSPLKNAQRPSPFGSSSRDAPVYSLLRGRGRGGRKGWLGSNAPATQSQVDISNTGWEHNDDLESAADAHPLAGHLDETSPLRQTVSMGDTSKPRMTRYGSILGSPPGSSSPILERLSLELPDPALDPARSKDGQRRDIGETSYDLVDGPASEEALRQQHLPPPRPPATQLAHTGNAYQVQRLSDDLQSTRSGYRSLFRPHRVNSTPIDARKPPLVKRVLSIAGGVPTARTSQQDNDVALEAYRELDFRQAEFFHFLDRELQKIESFYNEKEDEAIERLKVLHEQLHIMRNQRLEEVEAAERSRRKFPNGSVDEADQSDADGGYKLRLPGGEHLQHYKDSVVAQMDSALDKLGNFRQGPVGKTSKAMRDLGTPPSLRLDPDNRDYTRTYTDLSCLFDLILDATIVQCALGFIMPVKLETPVAFLRA